VACGADVSVTEAIAVRTGARRPEAGTDDSHDGAPGDVDASAVGAVASA
jgi:hypothetical protein